MPQIYVPYFNPIGHLYESPDGSPMDSVTTIIKAECGQVFFGDGAAAERGTAVHKTCQYFDEKDLDESKVPVNVCPYLEQYKLALAAHKIVVLENEMMRFHPLYLYAGQLDKIALVDGVKGIIDIKTGKEYFDHKWQLAAYKDMIKHEHTEDLKRWNLYLSPDSFRLVERTGAKDFQEFLALYTAHNILVKYGFRKQKGENI